MLIVFDGFIADMKVNKRFIPLVACFQMPKHIRLNATHCFIMKILYKDYSEEPFSFLVSDITLSLASPLRYRKNLLQNEF